MPEVVKAVADRAAIAIDNARLFQEAQEAVRMREDVVAIVSHDLRNPLNAITLSASTLIKREDLDERTAKTATRIFAAADRANRLIRDLLDFTQARVTGIPLHPKAMDLHELAWQVVEEVRSAHPERRIDLMTHGDGGGTWDAGRLAQVMANLIGNAIQHSPGGTAVRVVTRGEEGGVLLEVHNEGPPIPAELLPALFEPFQRGVGAGSGKGGSLGLGLFITRRIVEAHGGAIAVRSEAGAGTTFTVRLPRHAAPRPGGG
jgi:signal transduction histidine kinase